MGLPSFVGVVRCSFRVLLVDLARLYILGSRCRYPTYIGLVATLRTLALSLPYVHWRCRYPTYIGAVATLRTLAPWSCGRLSPWQWHWLAVLAFLLRFHCLTTKN